jgi:N-acetylglucosamine-6-sulfatase
VKLLGPLVCLLFVPILYSAQGCAPEKWIAGSTATREDALEHPNILFVITDDMRYDETRRIEGFEALAARGTSFQNAYVTNSVCCPSRTTALTGQYSHNHRVTSNVGSGGGYPAYLRHRVGSSTVATWLQRTGYRTALFGKFLNGYGKSRPPRGFHAYQPAGGGEKDPLLGKRAARFVENNHERGPLFIALWLKSPHGPLKVAENLRDTHMGETYPEPPSFDETDVSDKARWIEDLPRIGPRERAEITEIRQKRLRMLEGAAAAMKRTLSALGSTGERDNTYVVFSSDNGYMLGEHRIPGGKSKPYEESIHVPLVITGPGVPRGITRDELVANNDLAPTLAQWAGVEAPGVDGRSLAPLLTEGAVGGWREALLTENPGGDKAPGHAALITRTGVRYIEWETGERELYDLRGDPHQLKNVAGSAPPDRLEALHERLKALKSCARVWCRAAENGD